MDDPSFFVRSEVSASFSFASTGSSLITTFFMSIDDVVGSSFTPVGTIPNVSFFFTCPLTFSFHACVSISAKTVTVADDTFSFSDISSLSLLLIFLRVCFGLSHRKISSFPPLPFLKIWRAPRFTQTFLRLTIIFMRVSSPGYHHHRIFLRNYFSFSAELGFSLKSIW